MQQYVLAQINSLLVLALNKEVEARLAEEEKRLGAENTNASRQKLFITALSLALAIALFLGTAAFWQYRQTLFSYCP